MAPRHPASVPAVAHLFLSRLDDDVTVGGDEGHHLQRVRRLRVGEAVTGADGHGRWREYEVAASSGGTVGLRARSAIEHEPVPVPRLVVACALTKGERPELIVQKLTELGVDRIVLLAAARSVVRWDDDRAGHALTRLARVAWEAGAQSRRARVPFVEGPVAPAEITAHPGLVVADLAGVPADSIPLPRPGDPPNGEWVVAVGPEGGFDPAEQRGFGDAPRLAVGPHVLRAETAAIAAASALAGRRRDPV